MTVYVDFLSTIKILGSVAVYTGGTNYAKYIVEALLNNKNKNYNLKLLLSKSHKKEDKDFFSSFDVVHVDDFLEVDYEYGDILYLPQVNGTLLMKLPKIKKQYPYLKIYGTLHDRQHNIVRFDSWDTMFESGLKKNKLFLGVYYLLKKITFNLLYSRKVKALDKIFTVSNYSMQLLDTSTIKFIKYYIQGAYSKRQADIKRGDYILLVGGNRAEKNLFRALIAFRKYKSLNDSSLKFVATGISPRLKEKIAKKVDLKDDILFKPYVSNEELVFLYSNCKFVAFLSKAEGYGCPIREAMELGKVVLASRTTSIPEVAGAAMYYVDPFNINSIVAGIKYLDNDNNLDKYESYVLKRRVMVNAIAQQDLEIFLNDFFE